MKHILVTGGSGFIGSKVVYALMDLGYEVTIVDLSSEGEGTSTFFYNESCQRFFKSAVANAQIPNLQKLLGLSKKFDAVIHLAALPSVGLALEMPELVLENNFSATLAAAEFSRTQNVPLINISSAAVRCADLNTSPYALSKKMGEDIVNNYIKTFGIAATNVRLFNVFGDGEVDAGEFTTLVQQCKNSVTYNIPFPLFGDGSVRRDFVNVYDVVRAIMSILENSILSSKYPLEQLYEIGNGDAGSLVSVGEIVDIFRKNGMEVEKRPSRPGDPDISLADPALRPPEWSPMIHVISHINDWLTDFQMM